LVLATLLSLVDPLIIKWLIDSGLQRGRWPPILMAIAFFGLVYFARLALLFVSSLSSMRIIQHVVLRVRLRLLRRLQQLDGTFYDSHQVGDLSQRLEQDVEQAVQAGVDLLPTVVRIVVGASVTLVVMVALDWRLSCVVLPFVPAWVYLRAGFRKRFERAADMTRQLAGRRASLLNELLGACAEVQLLGAERFFHRKYARQAIEATRASFEQRRMELLYFAGAYSAITVVTGGVLLTGAWEVVRGGLTLGGYIAFYSYLTRLFDPLAAAVETYSRLKRAGGSIRRITEVERTEAKVKEVVSAVRLLPEQIKAISCRQVTFDYTTTSPVLRDVNVQIRRGQKVVLIGPSGSGKSTLAKLLTRLYDPCAGAVQVGDHDLRDVTLRSVREMLSLVPPHPVLFSGTIWENVFLGCRPIAAHELQRLARIACFDTVVEKFQGKWEHILGPSGAGLSDGEKQRLGLLRALVRDRPVLILDEATGSLDSLIERELLDRLEEYVQEKIVLFISHRAAAAAWGHRVLTLRDGRRSDIRSPTDRGIHGAPHPAASGDSASDGNAHYARGSVQVPSR
jgi:ABC-type multidrug transport system fused ATPase/permease subunit